MPALIAKAPDGVPSRRIRGIQVLKSLGMTEGPGGLHCLIDLNHNRLRSELSMVDSRINF